MTTSVLDDVTLRILNSYPYYCARVRIRYEEMEKADVEVHFSAVFLF